MDKKEQIIKTGMKLFVKQGFENTPTSQISKEAKVGTGTLFHHFKTKDDLVNEIYTYVKKSMANASFKNVNEKMGIKDQIKLIWNNLMEWGFKNRNENQFLERFYGSTYINKLTIEQMQSEFKYAGKLFENAKKNNIIRDISPELLESITFAINRSFLAEFYKKKKFDKKLLKQSFEMYWNAIKK